MDEEPDWAILLETLYDSQRSRFDYATQSDHALPDNHALIDDTGLSQGEVDVAIQYLSDAGLLTTARIDTQYIITEEGFQVAHERRIKQRQQESEDQRAKRQHQINRAVAFLTLGLMTVTVLDSAVRAFVGQGDFGDAYLAVGGGAVLIVAFTIVLNWSGLLSSYSDG